MTGFTVDRWQFRYPGFVIGAWWGPDATDAELRLYHEAGFNVVMAGRYMQLDDYADPEKGVRELDLARKHRLWVMFDTYTKNDRPWGGKRSEEPYEHPLHHPASLLELQWLYERLGKHPALLGFMIGDDQGEVTPRAAQCTRFLFEQPKPHLIPWLCGWIPPENLARHNNPIANPQIYPTLYEWQLSAEHSPCVTFVHTLPTGASAISTVWRSGPCSIPRILRTAKRERICSVICPATRWCASPPIWR